MVTATPKDPKNQTGDGSVPKVESTSTPENAVANDEVAAADERTAEANKDRGGRPWQFDNALAQAENELELAEAYGNTTLKASAEKRIADLTGESHREQDENGPRGRRTARKSTTSSSTKSTT